MKPQIGRGSVVERGAIVGMKPGRNVADLTLIIGEHARIRAGTIIYLGCTIGGHLETGHYAIIREENEIGDGFQIWAHSTIDYGCSIGNHVHIHTGVYVAQFTTLEDGVFIAPNSTLLNDPHPGCHFSRDCMKGPTIRKNAVIGGGVTILPMVTIGAGAVIGGGSVVTKDVPAGAVVYGNPAKVHGKRSQLTCKTGHTLRPYA